MTANNLIIIIILFIGCAENTFTQPHQTNLQSGTDETLDIITWNIKEFPKSNNSTIEYVSQIIIEMDVDIIALQEIQSTEDFENLINQLDGWSGYKASSAAYGIDLAFLYK